MKVTSRSGWVLASAALALFGVGLLLMFDGLWPWVRLRHDGEIAVGAWVVGALLAAAGAMGSRRWARGLSLVVLALHLLVLLGLGAFLLLWKPTRLF